MKTKHSGNRGRGEQALTRIEVVVIIGILFAGALYVFFLPEIVQYQKRAPRINCANNLKQIGLAFKLWAGDNQDRYPMQVPVAQGGTLEFVWTGLVYPHFQVMSNELYSPMILHCVSDKSRTTAPNFTTSLTDMQISYFIGVDATNHSFSTWLAGDRNLTTNGSPIARGLVVLTTNTILGWQANLHYNAGNVLLADASVPQPSSLKLPALFAESLSATNRFAVP
jgi:hypothetical protein